MTDRTTWLPPPTVLDHLRIVGFTGTLVLILGLCAIALAFAGVMRARRASRWVPPAPLRPIDLAALNRPVHALAGALRALADVVLLIGSLGASIDIGLAWSYIPRSHSNWHFWCLPLLIHEQIFFATIVALIAHGAAWLISGILGRAKALRPRTAGSGTR
ncbi:MAG: hypothetical protein JXP34_23640 [Planctomycetes bacterium]|nr:hypothetical protein [Planctomycetota bacterium]